MSAQRSTAPHTSNVEAWHAYLRSRYHFGKLTPERLKLSQTYAEQAIALDPHFAAPHAVLAECFIQTAIYGMRSGDEMMPMARAAALKAVALDDSEASAHMTLARVAGEYDRDWDEALRQCRIALASERVTPAVRALCAQYVLWPLGQTEEIMEAIRPALTADPLSPMPRLMHAAALYMRGERERAAEEIRAVLELHDHFWPGYLVLGQLHTVRGDTAAAIEVLEKALEVSPWNALAIGMLAGNYMRNGERERGEALLQRLELPQLALLRPLGSSGFHLVLEDFERAADGMAAMLDAHYPVASFYAIWMTSVDAFRESAAAQRLRERIKLD